MAYTSKTYERQCGRVKFKELTESFPFLHRQVVEREPKPGKKRKTKEWYVSYTRNRHDKCIYEHERQLAKASVFEGFPHPDRKEIERWLLVENKIAQQEDKWVSRNAPQGSQCSVAQLLWNAG